MNFIYDIYLKIFEIFRPANVGSSNNDFRTLTINNDNLVKLVAIFAVSLAKLPLVTLDKHVCLLYGLWLRTALNVY